MPKFESKHRNLRLVRRAQIDQPTPTGAWRVVSPSLTYSFAPDGFIEVEQGQDILDDGAPIRDPDTNAVIGFDKQDALEWLRSHPDYNSQGFGGFTEVGREPDRIPDAAPRIREIVAAMFAGDLETLEAFRDEEQEAAYSRPAVDAALAEAFEQIEARDGEAEDDGTPGNAAEEALAAAGMKELREVGRGLGLAFPPGTSLEQARDRIREARAARVAA